MKFNVTEIEFDFDDDHPEEKVNCNSDLETFFIASNMDRKEITENHLGVWEADDEEEAKEMALIHCKQYLHEYVDDIWVEEHKEENENNN